MSFARVILKYFSCLFNLVLGLIFSLLALFLVVTGADSVRMNMLPLWTGDTLKYWMLGLGLIGIFAAIMAALNKIRILLVLISLIALCLIIYGYFVSPYKFAGPQEAKSAVWLAIAAFVALLGSLLQFRGGRRA